MIEAGGVGAAGLMGSAVARAVDASDDLHLAAVVDIGDSLDRLQAAGVRVAVDFTTPDDMTVPVYDAAMAYAKHHTPLVILAGKEYGSGSSRDWAAKGTALLGVKAVIAESYERIHRSNLIGMGVLPLQFPEGMTADSLGLQGDEVFTIRGVTDFNSGVTPTTVDVEAVAADGRTVEFTARVRVDTPGEADYYRHGGILQYVLRSLV